MNQLNYTVIAQLINFIVLAGIILMLVMVPVVLFRVNRRVKKIEAMLAEMVGKKPAGPEERD